MTKKELNKLLGDLQKHKGGDAYFIAIAVQIVLALMMLFEVTGAKKAKPKNIKLNKSDSKVLTQAIALTQESTAKTKRKHKAPARKIKQPASRIKTKAQATTAPKRRGRPPLAKNKPGRKPNPGKQTPPKKRGRKKGPQKAAKKRK